MYIYPISPSPLPPFWILPHDTFTILPFFHSIMYLWRNIVKFASQEVCIIWRSIFLLVAIYSKAIDWLLFIDLLIQKLVCIFSMYMYLEMCWNVPGEKFTYLYLLSASFCIALHLFWSVFYPRKHILVFGSINGVWVGVGTWKKVFSSYMHLLTYLWMNLDWNW